MPIFVSFGVGFTLSSNFRSFKFDKKTGFGVPSIHNGLIDLWTFQDYSTIKAKFRSHGRYQASISNSTWIDDPGFMAAYRWMIWQMDQHGVERTNSIVLDPNLITPIWAWAKWTDDSLVDDELGIPKLKPDRNNQLFYGDEHDLIHLRVPVERVLMSDFDLFHCVLNAYEQVLWKSKSYNSDIQIPLTPFEEIWLQTPVEIYSPVDEIMLPDLIWDNFIVPVNDSKRIYETPFIQAVLWELLPEDVVEVDEVK